MDTRQDNKPYEKALSGYDWWKLYLWVRKHPYGITFDPYKANMQTYRLRFLSDATFFEWFFADNLRWVRFLLVFLMVLAVSLVIYGIVTGSLDA